MDHLLKNEKLSEYLSLGRISKDNSLGHLLKSEKLSEFLSLSSVKTAKMFCLTDSLCFKISDIVDPIKLRHDCDLYLNAGNSCGIYGAEDMLVDYNLKSR